MNKQKTYCTSSVMALCFMICKMIQDDHIRIAPVKYINMKSLCLRGTSRDVSRSSKIHQTLDNLEEESNLEENGCNLTFSFCTSILGEIRP